MPAPVLRSVSDLVVWSVGLYGGETVDPSYEVGDCEDAYCTDDSRTIGTVDDVLA